MSHEILFGRQPILDARNELYGYELLFRDRDNLRHAVVTDQVAATATVITRAFCELGIVDALGPVRGFINVDKNFLHNDAIELLPADKVVIEVLEHGEITPEVIERCRYLKGRGYSLALDDFIHLPEVARPILEVVDIVKVDLSQLDDRALTTLLGSIESFTGQLLAEKVETREQMKRCTELGFKLFQGYYFARPALVSGRRLSPAQASLVRLMNLIAQDAENDDVERAFKHEPALTLNLLRITNSVAMGLSKRITSIGSAITMLGRRQIQRWLQLLLYADPNSREQASNPLLILAATRGRYMELLTGHMYPRDRNRADLAFMTGIMSLMPAVFGPPMEEILDQIVVAPEVKAALLAREGETGALLDLAEASEDRTDERVIAIMERIPALDWDVLASCLSQALQWARQLGDENE
ncbi:MAG: EAL domain-containing protein [Sterolibacteriaceae bacterium MAG5]|nr:EAL domain-containing protein [Candidatus Nitricoxidireducens bremensis]